MSANIKSAIRLASLLGLVVSAYGCDQPPATCTVARGTFSARYTLVPGSQVGEGDCGTLVGEELYLQAYNQPKSAIDTNPNPTKVRIAIQPSNLLNMIWGAGGLPEPVSPDPEDVAYSLGDFVSNDPGKDNFCTVPTLTPARVRLPAIPEMTMADVCSSTTYPATDAVDALYEWSNVRVYLTPAANGTQFGADLKYTNNGCSAQYKVVALYPSISCAAAPSGPANPATGDDAGGPFADGGLDGMDGGIDAAIDEDGAIQEETDGGEECEEETPEEPSPDPVPDDSLCQQSAPPIEGALTGSSINPEFMVKCDPQQLRCVLSGDPPSLR